MSREVQIERFFEALIVGDRQSARKVITQSRKDGATAASLITDLFWPTYELIDRLLRADQLTTMNHHFASRLLRVLVDQNSAELEFPALNGRSVLVFCGQKDSDDLGAQMAADLLENAGFLVRFAGGGIANDEILGEVNQSQPDVLCMFASAAEDLPAIRQLIDTLTEIGAARDVQFAVGAGVFSRAEGLAEEIGADLWATSPIELVEKLLSDPRRRAATTQRTVGKSRRTRSAA